MDMDIPVPDFNPSMTAEETANINNRAHVRRQSVKYEGNNNNNGGSDTNEDGSPASPNHGANGILSDEKFEADAREYFTAQNIVPMLNALLMEVFLHAPEDPIDHMMKFLLRHQTLEELSAQHVHNAVQVQEHSDAAVAYSNSYRLPNLFDELLAKLLEEKPEDVLRFALSWMRWHKNDFIARYRPDGYKQYVEDREKRERGGATVVDDTPAS